PDGAPVAHCFTAHRLTGGIDDELRERPPRCVRRALQQIDLDRLLREGEAERFVERAALAFRFIRRLPLAVDAAEAGGEEQAVRLAVAHLEPVRAEIHEVEL